jgi:hypothetical protein
MMNGLAFAVRLSAGTQSRLRLKLFLEPRLVPPRSMVGQLPLEQHIGVRIPGGQPIRINSLE